MELSHALEYANRLGAPMWTNDYLRLGFRMGGRERPAVDCWGLYRLILAEQKRIVLPEYDQVAQPISIARELKRGPWAEGWAAIPAGEEQECDLVIMTGVLGRGREAIMAPMHVGCVIAPGRMIDIEETTGVMVRQFRTTPQATALPTLLNRVRGIFRPRELCR